MTAIGVLQSISKRTGSHPKMRNIVSLQQRCTCHQQRIYPNGTNMKTSQEKKIKQLETCKYFERELPLTNSILPKDRVSLLDGCLLR